MKISHNNEFNYFSHEACVIAKPVFSIHLNCKEEPRWQDVCKFVEKEVAVFQDSLAEKLENKFE